MLAHLRAATLMLLLLTALTGLVYPVAVTGIAQLLFPRQANGSLIVKDGKPVASELIGQPFDDLAYFWGSSVGDEPLPLQRRRILGLQSRPDESRSSQSGGRPRWRIEESRLRQSGARPVDLVTASGSGLDPHITPAAAFYQVSRVARVRGTDEAFVRLLVERHIEGRQFGLFGEPRVNVLRLNLAWMRSASRCGTLLSGGLFQRQTPWDTTVTQNASTRS